MNLEFDVARITIEMTSASIVTAGEASDTVDASFVRDANGLPFLPGTTLAGVLRHAYAGGDNPAESPDCRDAFGFQDGTGGQASRLRISGAQVHDQHDRPVRFRGVDPEADPVLRILAQGVTRDHVRIGAHGAVDGDGKFDRRLIPAGARFTFEVRLEAGGMVLADLLGLLNSPSVRLGGHTRRGLGAFKVHKVKRRRFDLRKKADWDAWTRHPVGLHENAEQLQEAGVASVREVAGRVTGTIKLKAVDTFLTKGRQPTGREKRAQNRDGTEREVSKAVPLAEACIVWTKDRGTVSETKAAPWLVPGSGIKGALRHRTLFHARRLHGKDPGQSEAESEAEVTKAVDSLFGDPKKEREGMPGRLYLDDVTLPNDSKQAVLQHVSLDRLTQGPMDGLLFDEVALLDVELEVPVGIDHERQIEPLAKRAFACAVKDLCEGRLPLGAGRSHGRFRGELKGPIRDWLEKAS